MAGIAAAKAPSSLNTVSIAVVETEGEWDMILMKLRRRSAEKIDGENFFYYYDFPLLLFPSQITSCMAVTERNCIYI